MPLRHPHPQKNLNSILVFRNKTKNFSAGDKFLINNQLVLIKKIDFFRRNDFIAQNEYLLYLLFLKIIFLLHINKLVTKQ